VRPDPEKVFDTRAEAERACDELNRTPPEYGHGQWYLGGPVEGKWWVIRWRGLMKEEVGDPRVYEEAERAAFERIAMDHEFWRETDGIRFEEVRLAGEFPDTELILTFRPVAQEPFAAPVAEDCVFGTRWPVWPASDRNPADEAAQLTITFQEFLAEGARGYHLRTGPCDPSAVNWLS
jgi:hypothetical protein